MANFEPQSTFDNVRIIEPSDRVLGGKKGAINVTIQQLVNRTEKTKDDVVALSDKVDTHKHDNRYYTESEIDTMLQSKSDTSHTHDNRYYTESEIDTMLQSKSDTSHTHNQYLTGITKSQVTDALGYTPPTTYSTATTSANGLMSSTMVSKLNNLTPRYHVGTTSSSSGYILIKIKSTIAWMLAFTVRIYASYSFRDIVISGYQYGANYWYNPKAMLLSQDIDSVTVSFGYTSANNLWVCIPTDMYTGCDIFNVTNGYTQITDLDSIFEVSVVSAIPATKQTDVTAYRQLKTSEISSWAKASSKPTYTASEVGASASSHTHSQYLTSHQSLDSCAKVGAHNNLIASGNEFTFVPNAFSGTVYFNYRTVGGTNGNITDYNFGNGKGGNLGTAIHSGNYKSYCTPANIGAAASSHTHSDLAPKASPTFTGTVTAPTLTVSTTLNIPGGKIWIE